MTRWRGASILAPRRRRCVIERPAGVRVRQRALEDDAHGGRARRAEQVAPSTRRRAPAHPYRCGGRHKSHRGDDDHAVRAMHTFSAAADPEQILPWLPVHRAPRGPPRAPPSRDGASMNTAVTSAVPPGTWSADPAHSRVAFAVKHMGIAIVRGEFK